MLGTLVTWGPGPLTPEILQTACGLASIALEHTRLCESLKSQASRDTLTGLANRNMLERRLASALQTHDGLALCWLDLDRFKEINESLGHSVGDELLRQVSARLQDHVPDRTTLARMGGDEFALVLPGADSETASAVSRNVLSALHAPFQLNGLELFVTASVGIALYPEHGLNVSELQQNADAAMYRAKSGGRNRFAIYEEDISITVRERMEIAQGLRRALQRNELRLFFQPQANLAGRIVGFEALLRWEHPNRGLLTPADFIGTAEETGLIVPIGTWVIEEACRQASRWNEGREKPLKVAVNVSSLQFYFSDLAEVVASALEKTGLPPECLELELTESILVRDTANCATDLKRLRSLGITIAIDDFGTGYSCLSYLQQLPVDVVKVDRSFLADLNSRSGAAVLEAITALAHSLCLQVIAEGVERDDQMHALREFGVDLVQGYLIGVPEPAGVVTKMISSGGPADSSFAGADKTDEMAGVL
jgi:diguanylate cyclase (GGDEF)-like protein